MKQFLTALAANFVTIALIILFTFLVIGGIASAIASKAPPEVRTGALLVVDLDRPFSDEPAREETSGFLGKTVLVGEPAQPLRASALAIRAAANDDRISGILIRGSITSDGVRSGFAALREIRAAISEFKTSHKPVHAWLVTPDVSTYYVASAADTITLDPFGSLTFPGLASEQMFLSGLFEKYGVGIQVSRVGRFKSAVEPYTRANMSPENRAQVKSYLGDLWSEVRKAVAESRGIDTLRLQEIVDERGVLLPTDAMDVGLIDRVAYFDVVLDDLQSIANKAGASGKAKTAAKDSARAADLEALLGRPALPQVSLENYASIAVDKARHGAADQAIAVVYAQGTIVDGEGSTEGQLGGDALARDLRKVRTDKKVKAVVLRVNSPGGSVLASERIQRELSLINREKPVVVSMGSLAASGGYWISTASRLIFAEPNTITGSIGVFSIMPNLKVLASRHGITFDTASTGRYAGMMSVTRPRSEAELAVIQHSVDVVYDSFIERVASARKLSQDSVRAIAEGRVWSGQQALRLGLVDSLGSLDTALRSAARMAAITGDYDVREYPRLKTQLELISELIEPSSTPVAEFSSGTAAARSIRKTAGGEVGAVLSDVVRELSDLSAYNDPRGLYARMPYLLRIR